MAWQWFDRLAAVSSKNPDESRHPWIRLEAIAIRLEAIASRSEVIAVRIKTITSKDIVCPAQKSIVGDGREKFQTEGIQRRKKRQCRRTKNGSSRVRSVKNS